MSKKELKLISELDEICSRLAVSYTLRVMMGIGADFTVHISDKIDLKFGGFDRSMVGAFEEAIQALLNAESNQL